ncbi:MAG: hypothetical protein KIS96_14445 [Bauldia sp.]|nr:hypothetical protein [Bauldia sp.]
MTVASQHRMAQVEKLLAAPPSWDELVREFAPAAVADPFAPEDRIKRFLAALWQTGDGRAVLDWLFALTLDAPYPHIGQTRDAAALAAKAHEARVAVGRAVLAAIAEGETLLSQPKEPES